MTIHKTGAAALALGLALAVSACGSSHHGASGSTSSTTSTGAPTTPDTTATSAPSTSAPTTSSPTTAPPATATTSAGPVRCQTAALRGALTGANGAAGSVYYNLVLTNQGASACIMQGYPGVSFVTGSSGQQLGAPASRAPGSAPSFLLSPGASARAVLQITEAGNYGSACQITPVAGLRVYPPNQTASLFIAHADQGCANPAIVTLHVGPLQSV